MKKASRYLCLLILAAATALVAACGGSGVVSADEDPKAVLERAFSDESAVESAKIDATVKIEIEGEEAGIVEMGLNGAIANASADAPDTDLDFTVKGDVGDESVDFEAGAILTPKEGFVRLSGDTYEIDPGMYEQIRGQVSQQTSEGENADKGGLFGSLDAQAFLNDVSNDGTEEVEGVETVKISGTVDTEKAFAEFESFMASADQLQGLGVEAPGSDEFDEVKEALGDVDFDIYVGTEDGIIRKMEFSAPVNPPNSDSTGNFTVSVTLADVNEEQEITAPSDAKPFDELIAAIGEGALSGLGIEGFNDIGQLGGGSNPFDRLSDLLDGGSGSKGGGGSSKGKNSKGAAAEAKDKVQEALGDASEELDEALNQATDTAKEALDCIQKARTVEEISKCEELVK